MAYNESMAKRIREIVASKASTQERKMFGGVAFFLNGNMACGLLQDHLMVRVGADRYEELLTEPFAKQFNRNGRVMKGWIQVDERGLDHDEVLEFWVNTGLDYAATLPPKV